MLPEAVQSGLAQLVGPEKCQVLARDSRRRCHPPQAGSINQALLVIILRRIGLLRTSSELTIHLQPAQPSTQAGRRACEYNEFLRDI
jgi:hypothetical protein